MSRKEERKLRKANFLERNHQWYYPFKGTLFAGLILLVLHELYEFTKFYW